MAKVPHFCMQLSPGIKVLANGPQKSISLALKFMGLALLFISSYVHLTVSNISRLKKLQSSNLSFVFSVLAVITIRQFS